MGGNLQVMCGRAALTIWVQFREFSDSHCLKDVIMIYKICDISCDICLLSPGVETLTTSR